MVHLKKYFHVMPSVTLLLFSCIYRIGNQIISYFIELVQFCQVCWWVLVISSHYIFSHSFDNWSTKNCAYWNNENDTIALETIRVFFFFLEIHTVHFSILLLKQHLMFHFIILFHTDMYFYERYCVILSVSCWRLLEVSWSETPCFVCKRN